MSKLFDIQDQTVVITDLTLINTRGAVQHNGSLNVTENLDVNYNLNVNGTISANTFNVKNLITDNGSLASVGNWLYNTEQELNGKGFNWTYGLGQTQLIYRTGGRLWTNANLDLASGNSYSIDDIPVLSAGALGGSITSSSLTSVGVLNNLNVSGDTNLGDLVFVNTSLNRIGIGTEDPSSSLTILDNNVEIGIGSPASNLATIGTVSCHDLAIVTDNLARITIRNSGEVNVAGNLNVAGVINAGSVVTDNRIDRTHPLQFSATKDTSIFGLGLVWSDVSITSQLTMMSGPTRLWSSENIDIASEKFYAINNIPVLSSTNLGNTVIYSNLNTVGTLNSLIVQGPAVFNTDVTTPNISIGTYRYTANGIDSNTNIQFSVNNSEIVYGDSNQINVGDKNLQNKPVKVLGH